MEVGANFNRKYYEMQRVYGMDTYNNPKYDDINTYDEPHIKIFEIGEKYIHLKVDDYNVTNIKFSSSSGYKVMISINKYRPLKDLFKEYARRVGFPEFYLGVNIVFIFNTLTIDVNDDTHTIGEFFPKDLITITVIEQKETIGANIIKKNFYKKIK